MISNANAVSTKKESGLSDLFKGYAPQQLEEQHHPKREQNYLQEAFSAYKDIMNEENIIPVSLLDDKVQAYPDKDIPYILTPQQIHSFFRLAKVEYEDNFFHHHSIGHFIGRLIQNSYDAGFNNFLLEGSSLDLHYLLSYVQGTATNPLKATIVGGAGGYCAGKSQYLHLTIKGNVGYHLAYGAQNSILILDGRTSHGVGNGSTNTTFKTANIRTVESFRHNHDPFFSKTNKLVFVHANGDEVMIRHDY